MEPLDRASAGPGFPGLIGHTDVRAGLSRALERGQLHHALLILGPPGVGKSTLARGLGCAMHCPVAPGRGCGTCGTCRRVLAGHHAGVERLGDDSGDAIKVGDATNPAPGTARELRARVSLAPFEGDVHLVIIDPAEAVVPQAWNALLKLIEEPPAGVRFAIVAASPGAVLDTIASRCMPVRLGRLGDDEVRAVLGQMAAAEAAASAVATAGSKAPAGRAKPTARSKAGADEPSPATERARAPLRAADPARVELAVRLAEGSAGAAATRLADPRFEAMIELTAAVIAATRGGLPAIFSGDRGPLWQAWAAACDGPKTGKPARERAAAEAVAALWRAHLREQLRGGPGLPGLPVLPASPDGLLAAAAALGELQRALERNNANARLALEATLLAVAAALAGSGGERPRAAP